MTSSTNDFLLDDERLTPELSALEARLSDLKPRTLPGADETKSRGFLLWRGDSPRRRREFDAELAEAVVRVGEQNVAEALRRYLQATRTGGFLFGLVCGLVVGGVASVFALQYCVRLVDSRRDDVRGTVRNDTFFSSNFKPDVNPRYTNGFNDLPRMSTSFSANAFVRPRTVSPPESAPFASSQYAPNPSAPNADKED